jgi:hypothetical protein
MFDFTRSACVTWAGGRRLIVLLFGRACCWTGSLQIKINDEDAGLDGDGDAYADCLGCGRDGDDACSNACTEGWLLHLFGNFILIKRSVIVFAKLLTWLLDVPGKLYFDQTQLADVAG